MKQILYYKLKACFKRYVFTWHLKFDRESRLDISLGRLHCSRALGPHNRMLYYQVLGVSCAWNLKNNFFPGSEGISC